MENEKIIKFLFLILFNISIEDLYSCSYPLTRRLISGNYLLICSNEINFYDATLQYKIKEISSPSFTGTCMYYTNSAQFLKEDGEYVIVGKNYNIYIFSKFGEFLSSQELGYLSSSTCYSIVPYGHSNNLYYFALMYISGKSIIFKNYRFNSLSNETSQFQSFSYTTNITGNLNPENAISCSLMKYSNKNVITCFYGSEYIYACTVFDPNNSFQTFTGLKTQFSSISEVG